MVRPPDESSECRARVKIKRSTESTLRVTPPEPIRDHVGLEHDEPWAWFWIDGGDRFMVRRVEARMGSIPDTAEPAGVSRPADQDRYLDFAIPATAVEVAGVEKGQEWEWRAVGRDTLELVRVDD